MRILLVDDHILFMKGLRFLLAELSDGIVCFEANSCQVGLNFAQNESIDLVLLDWNLPELSGVRAIQSMRECLPDAPIVIVSGDESPSIIRSAIDAGALGFIPKTSTPEVLTAALQLVLAGGTYIPKCALYNESNVTENDGQHDHPILDHITQKQMEVLARAIQGKPNKTIARELNLSDSTVKAHLSAAFVALRVSNRTEAVFAAARLGLTPKPA